MQGTGGYRKLPIPVKDSESIMDKSDMDINTKLAAAVAFPSVVGLLSRNLPYDMAVFNRGRRRKLLSKEEIEDQGGELVFWGCGIIIECEEYLVTRKYFSTIISHATLFVRTDGSKPSQIKVDVCLWDGKVCNGQVVACDFHYNLAAIRIESDSPLPTPTLRGLDDVFPFRPTELLQLQPETSFELLQMQPETSIQPLPDSNLFKVVHGTKIITLGRSFEPRNAHLVGSGVFWTTMSDARSDCNELYFVKDSNYPERNGGAVINYSGEVIGLMFYDSPFLPINMVSSWWTHYKSCGQYRRPWLGVKIANLYSSSLNFLAGFIRKFPNVTVGVVVTEVADSLNYSGICPKDVIVECDGLLVRSILEFIDIIWNKVGESIEVTVLRVSEGEALQLSLTVEETPDKFYQWKQTFWKIVSRAE